nr:ATP-binding protein [Halorhodospira halochloris]
MDSDLCRVAELCRAWEELAGEIGLDETAAVDVELALSEAVNNAIIHAYQREPGHTVQVTVTRHQHRLVVAVTDHGRSMPESLDSLLSRLEQDADAQYPEEGGRGLAIIASLMEEVAYRSGPSGNTLEMRYPLDE